MIDICFVTTPIPELMDDKLEAPLGYLYVASYLNNKGFNAGITDICGLPEAEWEFPQARYYGFSTYSTTYHRTVKIKNMIKEQYPDAVTVAGGAHASALPDEVSKEFDYVVHGEGELAAECILNGYPKGILSNYHISELDSIPFPDYDLVDVGSYHRVVAGKHSFSILTTRGCPNKCAFCNSIIMGGRNRVRFRSPENVINEIKALMEKYGDINIRFQDDMFGVSLEWLRNFTQLIKPLDITYRAFVRASQCCKKEFVELLVDGGCKHIALGIESGSDLILKNMQKGQTVDQCRIGLKNAKDAGLIRRIYLIVGFPGETWDTAKATVDFIKETRPDEFVAYPLIPYPGTPIYKHAEEYGILNIDRDFTHYFQICGDAKSWFVYDLPNADRIELQAMKDYVVKELQEAQAIWARDSKGYI